MSRTKTKIHGLEVEDVTYKDPRNSLPKFVREAATTRGYGDATQPLSLFIQDGDVAEAFACAAQGNGSACVMAQAGKRIGAKAVYFYRTTAWVDFGSGPIVRFQTTKSIYDNVIAPFDAGDRERVMPGIYHLTPPSSARGLAVRREREKDYRPDRRGRNTELDGSRAPRIQAHTERVVMAARV